MIVGEEKEMADGAFIEKIICLKKKKLLQKKNHFGWIGK